MIVEFNVRDFLDRAEVSYPDRQAVIDEPNQPAPSWGSPTFAELAARARAQAAGLDALGVGPGERVAVVSQNSARLLTSFFGVSGWGRILVPINFRLAPAEVSYIVGHAGASVLLVDPELEDALAAVGVEHRFVLGSESDEVLFPTGIDPRPWSADEQATATINYTSGTTARPKGVQLTHRNCWVNAAVFGWHAQVSDRDVYLHTLPMFHANGWGMPWATTAMGCPQVVLRKVDGHEILRRVERHGVSLLCAAPAVVNAVLDALPTWDGPVPGRDRVRVVVAGAPPPRRTIERVETELGWEFIQIYGLTETAPLLTFNRQRSEWDDLSSGERARKLMRAGAPAIGTAVEIAPDGEVLARSNTVMEGYWHQPEATETALEGGWFHTGDGGVLDEELHLHILDRKKDVIITGGENVSSIEVEDAIFSLQGVVEVAVIGIPHDTWGEMVAALVVADEGAGLTQEAVITHCRAILAGYKCPKQVEFRAELPRTATGKLQKFRLRSEYWEGYERQVN
ncbi:MAG: AMP-binding protein [Acidimicrobiales bacterium]|jgi:acyl-CoA synthetase (AMP-forming)/AMP-acid ligase II